MFTLLLLSCLAVCDIVFAADKPVTVLASFYSMYVAALNVTAEVPGVTVTWLTEPFTGCLHDYQLKPTNLKMRSKADVFVANGTGMETFLTESRKATS